MTPKLILSAGSKLRLREATAAETYAKKNPQYRVSSTSWFNPAKPYCDDPQGITLTRRPGGGTPAITAEFFVPCRKCEKCLLFRQLKWAERMTTECLRHERSWFVTLTFDPTHLMGIVLESYKLTKIQSPEAAIEAAAYSHVQRYFKRLRKNGARFSYAAVPELGSQTERLHYHLLLHETALGSTSRRLLDRQWRSFTTASLVKSAPKTGAYVSKYLTKSISRIRASQNYGKVRNG